MIRFIVAPGHEYTFNALVRLKRAGQLDFGLWNYTNLFGATVLPPAVQIFCDIERLADWEMVLAGEIARLVREAGGTVINDPARAAGRYELLLRLHQAGFNKFRAWRAEDGIPPARYPVFLRHEANHSRPVSALIETPGDLAAAIEAQVAAGIARRVLLIVEYQAEEFLSGVFRKYAAYRFGDRIVADHLVHDVTWAAKYGAEEAWNDDRYAEELEFVRDNPHAEALMQAFEIAGIGFGRADYGIVDGQVQVWEINTNPVIPSGESPKIPEPRRATMRLAEDNRVAALTAMDVADPGPPIKLASDILDAHRERQIEGRPDIIRE